MEQGPARTSRRESCAVEDGGDLVAGVEDGGRGGLGDGALFLKKDGRKDDFGPLDAEIFSGVEHGLIPWGAGCGSLSPTLAAKTNTRRGWGTRTAMSVTRSYLESTSLRGVRTRQAARGSCGLAAGDGVSESSLGCVFHGITPGNDCAARGEPAEDLHGAGQDARPGDTLRTGC